MSESKRIKIDDQAASSVLTESKYQTLKKENDLLKQALDEQRDREEERTAELKAHEDISQLLVTGKWSDVTISVKGKKFAVHRNILSARSSFFANLLEQNQRENCLMINDVPVGVFEVLLNFIYTGKVPSLELQMAKDLLVAADKYKLEQLKSLTEDYLCAGLSLESVASLHSLAEVANAAKLKDKCLKLSHATSSATPPLARLPDLCLLALFRQLPPVDQMSSLKTCHRWSTLVPVANQPHVRSLTIVFNTSLDVAKYRLNSVPHGPQWELLKLVRKEDGSPLISIRPLTKWNSLQFSTLDEETITQIVTTFPVVKDLQLCAHFTITEVHCDCCAVTPTPPPDLLVRLLEQWRPQLANLNLNVDISSPSEHQLRPSFDRLVTVINSLPALKNLSIDLNLNKEPFLPALTIFPQLTQFNSNLHLSQISDTLHRYVPGHSQLMQIRFGSYKVTAAEIASLSSDLRRRIICFGLLQNNYRSICNLFHSLTSVFLALSDATFRDLLTHACQLTQLVHLQLSIEVWKMLPDDQPHRPLPQLTSVKLLRLLFINSMQTHADLESLNLGWTMPNLQVIQLEIYVLRCNTCGIFTRSTPQKKMQCLRQVFAVLKRSCTELHTIRHNFEKELGTAEEILAEQSDDGVGAWSRSTRRAQD